MTLEMVLELVRAEQGADPYAFRFAPQEYLLRGAGGGFESARFEWDERLLADLQALRQPGRDPVIAQRLGEVLRKFLASAGWAEREAQIVDAARNQRPIFLTLRFAAAELYALPWELLTIKSTGQHLGELSGLLLRYEWPESASISEGSVTHKGEGGRILFAWSAAGGAVPAADQRAAIESACQKGFHPFDAEHDVLEHLSCGRLSAALQSAQKENRPIAVLHLLCHGSAIGSTYGLAFDGEGPDDGAVIVDPARLRQLLAPYATMIRLVVLSACDSGNSGALGNQLGSVAQTLHRAGIAKVVASRYPLSVSGSLRITSALYAELLRELSPLEGALRAARTQLLQDAVTLDWASVQLYARAEDGNDTRPIAFRPFRGLLAFQPQHHRFFFGREVVVDEICRDLSQLQKTQNPRFLIVAGASGTGKSSVVLAGALPRLCAENSKLRVITLRPGSDPEKSLTQALGDLSASAQDPLLLVIDQFEELFTHAEREAQRQSFARRLWQLASDTNSNISIIATLRVDFIGRCGELTLDDSGLRLDAVAYDEAHRVFVSQMNASSLRQAIEEPARLCGLRLEEGLAQRMIADVGGEPGALPLLEDTLDLLWQRRTGKTLTQSAYDEVGGVAGALKGRADALMQNLGAEEQRVARRLLVRLVNVADDISLSTRRRVQLRQLRPSTPQEAAIFDRVLARLIDARLLVRDGEGQAQLIEVAHEALIRKWPQLGDWVKADRKMLVALERIDSWVREWQDKDLGTLLTASRIGFVDQFIKDYPDDCPKEARALLAASQADARRRQRTRNLLQRALIIASLAVAVAGGFGIYQARRVAQAASASRDAARMNAVRTFIAEGAPAQSMGLLREIEDQDLEHLPGYFRTAVELLRDVAQFESTWKLPLGPSADWSTQFAISADCTHIAEVELQTSRVRLFEQDRLVDTLPLDKALIKKTDRMIAPALSADARSLVLFSDGQGAWLLRFDNKQVVTPVTSGNAKIIDAGFSPDGSQLLALDRTELLHAWKSDGTGGPTSLPFPHHAAQQTLSLAAERFILATRTTDSRLHSTQVYDPWLARTRAVELWSDKRRRTLLFDREENVRAVALCADQQRIATVGETGYVRLWRLGKAPLSLGMYMLPSSEVRSAHFSKDGRKLVIAFADGVLQVWNSDGTGRPAVLTEPAPIRDFAVSADFRRLLILHADGSARIRSIDDTDPPLELPEQYSELYPTSFSSDGKRVLIKAQDDKPRVLDAKSGSLIQRIDDITWSKDAIDFSPDGSKLAWLNREAHIKLLVFDDSKGVTPESGRKTRFADINEPPQVLFSADGENVLLSDGRFDVRSFSVKDLSETTLLKKQRSEQIWLSPLATHFALAGGSGIQLSDAAQHVHGLVPWPAEPRRFQSDEMIFSQDGSRFLGLTNDDAISAKVDGSERTILPVEDRRAQHGVLSPDGKMALLFGEQGIPVIYNLALFNSLRPAALRKQMWEMEIGCTRSDRINRLLNLSWQAARWDARNCEAMQHCVRHYRNAAIPFDGHAACLKEFQAKQTSWLRESTYQTLPGQKIEQPSPVF